MNKLQPVSINVLIRSIFER